MIMSVAALGYLGLTTTGSLEVWADFARDVLGAEVRRSGERLRLRIDDHVYRIEVAQSDRAEVSHVGWDAGSPTRFEAIRRRLGEAGIPYEAGSPSLCKERGVLELLLCSDPAGIRLELFYGRMSPTEPFNSSTGTRFVTGHLGLGHLVFKVGNYERSLRFYQDVLGFEMTDVWEGDTGSAVFMHCNPRHHSLALRQGEGDPQLIHFMLEVDSLDAVGLASKRGAAAVSRSLGRHFNDRMISCYFRTPSGFEVEYGTGGRQIDVDNWLVGQIDAPSGWGHERRSTMFDMPAGPQSK